MLSLYRRHRPRTFDEVIGQEQIVRTLRNAVELDKVHHAYLFVGSRGTGKTSMAKLLASALNAEDGPRTDFSPEDPAVAAIASGTSLDVVEMDAASNNSVDDVRELRQNVALAPVGGGRRVYILDEAHMLSPAAWNAFLKTLEEPPPHVVFVLATTEAHKVPATIIDRCHRFDFRRPSPEQIAGVVERVAAEEGIELPQAAPGMIARSAEGSFRDALGTLEQLATYGGKRVELDDVLESLGVADAELVLATVESLADHDPKEALLAVERLSEAGRDYERFMSDLTVHLRDLFVVKTLGQVPESLANTAEDGDRLATQAERLSQGEIVRSIELLAVGLGRVRDGGEARIELEVALLKAVQPPADTSLQALMFRIEQLEQRVAGQSHAPDAAGGASASTPRPPAPNEAAVVSRSTEPSPSPSSSRGSAAPAVASEIEPEAEPEPAPEPVQELDLERIEALWPAILDAVRETSPRVGALLGEARPTALDGLRLTITFPSGAEFYRKQAEAKIEHVRDALRGMTGGQLAPEFASGGEARAQETPALSEDELVARLSSEFGAREILSEETAPPPDEKEH